MALPSRQSSFHFRIFPPSKEQKIKETISRSSLYAKHLFSKIKWLLLRHHQQQQHEQHHQSSSFEYPGSGSGNARPRKCYLLDELPFEVREVILRHCLPRTIAYRGGTAWCKGSLSVLRANKQLYAEGTDALYRHNTFALDVIYDCSFFAMTWLTPTQNPARVLHVRRQRAFPECIAAANVPKIRRLEITVRHVDSYTGMIKYGYGGGGLTEGLKTQVMFLCQVLRTLPVIDLLEISYQCQELHRKEETQNVLDPFFTLQNVRQVITSGHVLEKTSQAMVQGLPEARERRLLLLTRQRAESEEQLEQSKADEPPPAAALPSSSQPGEKLTMRSLASYRGYDDRDI